MGQGIVMDLNFDSKMLKGPLGVVAVLLIVAAALCYMYWRRSALVKQGRAEVERYLKMELPVAYLRSLAKLGSPRPDPDEVKKLAQVQVIKFSPSYLFRADRDDKVKVQAVVRVGTGKTLTRYFYFKSVLGRWKLRREAHKPLLPFFR